MLKGNLSSFSLISLMQICDNENKSGAIIFADPQENYECGEIYFSQGYPVYAHFFDRRGMEAIQQLHLASRHDFHFQEGKNEPGKNIEKDLNFILLECSRHKDEIEGYMQKLKPAIAKRFGTESVKIFDYGASCLQLFTRLSPVLDLQGIDYYEFSNDDRHSFIFFDKNISAHIIVDAEEHLYTDEILAFLREKEILA